MKSANEKARRRPDVAVRSTALSRSSGFARYRADDGILARGLDRRIEMPALITIDYLVTNATPNRRNASP